MLYFLVFNLVILLSFLFTKIQIILILFSLACTAQTEDKNDIFFKVTKIDFAGNKRTKNSIITREMDFTIGDSIPMEQLSERLMINRNKIFNTGLFVSVDVRRDSLNDGVVLVLLHERWYTFPFPLFDLADRSFNEWWYRQNRDLKRVNYGVWFEQANMRGRNEKFKILLQSGFTQKYEFSYDIPYINKKQVHGLSLGVGYAENKEIFYKSLNNKQVFIKSENVLRTRFFAKLNYRYRPSFFESHNLEFRFSYNTVADTIVKLNPDYFLNSNTTQQFYTIRYNYFSDHRDVQMYALKGYHTAFEIEKIGLLPNDQLNLLQTTLTHSRYWALGKNLFFVGKTKLELNLPNKQPYYNLQALGYGQDYIRGYDLYVIDATSFGYIKNTLRKRIVNKNINLNKIMPLVQFRSIPISVYFNIYNDYGYAHRKLVPKGNERMLNNLLVGYGAGCDIVTFYDIVIRTEYSINKYGENGLYFYILTDIVF